MGECGVAGEGCWGGGIGFGLLRGWRMFDTRRVDIGMESGRQREERLQSRPQYSILTSEEGYQIPRSIKGIMNIMSRSVYEISEDVIPATNSPHCLNPRILPPSILPQHSLSSRHLSLLSPFQSPPSN